MTLWEYSATVVEHNKIANVMLEPDAPSREEYEQGLRHIRALNLPNVKV